ncbi:hypothetical protein CSKR_102722 [Clonorchis sinensis]|uniref:Uncharacterized protein n=1 Tax=Clonorchis sinensis TaxID=79923 RepID=A0A419Q5A4_CLOSI|nr:hypothetical protein CSKR_102722 [Clonorchis sinensis]
MIGLGQLTMHALLFSPDLFPTSCVDKTTLPPLLRFDRIYSTLRRTASGGKAKSFDSSPMKCWTRLFPKLATIRITCVISKTAIRSTCNILSTGEVERQGSGSRNKACSTMLFELIIHGSARSPLA